jgi:hypothetical protein
MLEPDVQPPASADAGGMTKPQGIHAERLTKRRNSVRCESSKSA